MKILAQISKWGNTKRRKKINQKNRLRLLNKNFSLIANTCNGGVVCHDLGVRFNSPFVNLWIYSKDYIKIVKNLREYLSSELVFYPIGWGVNYPVARLLDADIYFMHYGSINDAKDKWYERCERVNYNNLFVLFTEMNGCTVKEMEDFDRLEISNKILLTHIEYPEIKNSFYIKGFENKIECGILSNWLPHKISGKRYLDQFDWVKWFNGDTF